MIWAQKDGTEALDTDNILCAIRPLKSLCPSFHKQMSKSVGINFGFMLLVFKWCKSTNISRAISPAAPLMKVLSCS